MIKTVNNKNNEPIATLDVQDGKVIVSEILSADLHDLDYIHTTALQYQHEIDEALRQKAHDAQKREMEIQRLERIDQQAKEAQDALEAFEALQRASSNITYHLSQMQNHLILDYDSADKSNYMSLAIQFAKSLNEPTVLVSDHYFNEKQRHLLARLSHQHLRIISLAEVHNGNYNQAKITHPLLTRIYDIANLLIQTRYFTTHSMHADFSTLIFLHNYIEYSLHLRKNHAPRFYVDNVKRDRKDVYLQSTYKIDFSHIGSVQNAIDHIDDIVARIESEYLTPYSTILDRLSEGMKTRIDSGKISVEMKGSPIALLINIRKSEAYVEVGSVYTLNHTSYTLRVNNTPTRFTRRYPLDQLEQTLTLFETYRPFNAFRNQNGYLQCNNNRYETIYAPIIEKVLQMNDPKNMHNRYVEDEGTKIISFTNIYK